MALGHGCFFPVREADCKARPLSTGGSETTYSGSTNFSPTEARARGNPTPGAPRPEEKTGDATGVALGDGAASGSAHRRGLNLAGDVSAGEPRNLLNRHRVSRRRKAIGIAPRSERTEPSVGGWCDRRGFAQQRIVRTSCLKGLQPMSVSRYDDGRSTPLFVNDAKPPLWSMTEKGQPYAFEGRRSSGSSAPITDARRLRWHSEFEAQRPYAVRRERSPYSITSPALASNVAGTVRPSTLAVLRLMISSNFVGGMILPVCPGIAIDV
jgi:hypothetical protein